MNDRPAQRRRATGPGRAGRSTGTSRHSSTADAKPPAAKPGLAARKAAAAILLRVIADRRPLDPLLDAENGDAAFLALDERDRRLVRAIIATALRRRGTIGRRLAGCLDGPLKDRTGRIAAILHVAAAQILFLDTPGRAAVDLAVTQARAHPKTRHAAGLVNAVLRRLAAEERLPATKAEGGSGDEDALNEDALSDTPDWLARRWTAAYGRGVAEAVARAHREPPPLDLTARGDAQRVAGDTGGMVLPTGSVRTRAGGNVAALPGYGAGAWWVQDAAAALPARLLGTVSGLSVADLCAAPGGKTAQLIAAGARVTAVEAVASRAARLKSNLERLHLSAEVVTCDIMDWRPSAPFDAILLDVPCTATGTLRRHPDIAWIKKPEDIAAMAAIQAAMLERAAGWLRPGGRLVYCTCSLEPEECEEQVDAFLTGRSGFAREPVRAAEIGGFQTWINRQGDLRTLPHFDFGPAAGEAGMDGFYAARLRRV